MSKLLEDVDPSCLSADTWSVIKRAILALVLKMATMELPYMEDVLEEVRAFLQVVATTKQSASVDARQLLCINYLVN